VQRVKIDNDYSNELVIDYSVPQGTVLGPLLFIIFINGLLNQEIPGKIICFADDTVILLQSPCINNLYKMAEESFIIVKNWLDNNSLEINNEKTNYIHFGIQKAIDLNNYKIIAHTNSCIVSNNKNNLCICRELNIVNSIKYLGLYIDANLKWNVHINYINNTLRKFFYVYKSLRSILTFKLKKMTYTLLVQSILSYGISFFMGGGTYHTHFRYLEITLNSLLKFIFNKPALFPTANLYKELEVFNLKTLYTKYICLLFYDTKKYIDVPCHNYNTRFKTNTNVIVPKMHTVFGQQSLKYKFISFCIKYNFNLHDFNSFKMYKKYINNVLL